MNQASTSSLFSTSPDFYLLFLIFLLSLVVVGVYAYFSSKLSRQKLEFIENEQKSKEMEKKKNILLANMSDDIYQLTQNLVKQEEEKESKIDHDVLNSANNLRELLKIQANKVEVYHEKFALSQLLDEVTMYLASNFDTKSTELIFDIDKNALRNYKADVVHLGRIINNILTFSITATPEGSVTLKVSTAQKKSAQTMLNITIIDTSIGLLDNAIDTLFDLGYDEKTQQHSGLELYIAKSLTQRIGGNIEVNSRLGVGNTFNLQIPVVLDNTYVLPDHNDLKTALITKKVLIYSEKEATQKSLNSLFSYFYTHVSVVTKEDLDKRFDDYLEYNLFILDDIFFDSKSSESLNLIRDRKNIHVFAISNIFALHQHEDNDMIDLYMDMPLHLEKIAEVINGLSQEKEIDSIPIVNENKVISRQKDSDIIVFKEVVEETPNIDIDCFTYFKGARLLIVEDNLINQKIILSVLKKSGIEIEIANNGQEALDILFSEGTPFDIVLMDISMPVMDGLIATKKIREEKAFDTLPIITFTAFAMGVEIEQMFEAGCNAYLTKPLNIKKLYTVLAMFLGTEERDVSLKKSIEIEGLDIEQGIEWADESDVLYKETLKEFVLVYSNTIALVPKWIKEKNYDRVHMACVDIQGMLGAIGAYEMKELVDEMQKIFLYHNEEFLDKYILLYPAKLNSLMETINRYIKN